MHQGACRPSIILTSRGQMPPSSPAGIASSVPPMVHHAQRLVVLAAAHHFHGLRQPPGSKDEAAGNALRYTAVAGGHVREARMVTRMASGVLGVITLL